MFNNEKKGSFGFIDLVFYLICLIVCFIIIVAAAVVSDYIINKESESSESRETKQKIIEYEASYIHKTHFYYKKMT